MKETVRRLLDFLFPRRCVVCGEELETDQRNLCAACRSDIPYTYNWNMELNPMSRKINERIAEWLTTQPDIFFKSSGPNRYVHFSNACALFLYRAGSKYRELTVSIKYYRHFDVARELGYELGVKMAAPAPDGTPSAYSDVDCIIPVPLHPLRRLTRGYNQAELLAQGIAEGLKIKNVDTQILKRVRYTKTQTKLSTEAKAQNVSDAFDLTPNHQLQTHHHILLVDDVFTTGSTMLACYKALRPHFDGKISFAALAMYSE